MAEAPQDARYGTIASQTRAHSEGRGDWKAALPMVTERENMKSRKFCTMRLRELERLMLTIDPSGSSRGQQRKMLDFLSMCDRTRSDMDSVEADGVPLRSTFPTITSFQTALKDDVDEALSDVGFKKVTMREDGQSYQAFFLSARDVVIKLMRKAPNIGFWSGPDGPAAPTNRRETPLDGDACRKCEADVIKKGAMCCVLGLRLYSASSQLSWSGGEFFWAMFASGIWYSAPLW